MTVQLEITETAKNYAPKGSEFQVFNNFTAVFSTLGEAQLWLIDRYGKCKRTKMHQDSYNGSDSIHCGYVYGFRNEDISHTPVEKWIQQDWVKFRTLEIIDLDSV